MTQLNDSLNIKAFNYPLPDERIARHPLQERDQCRLLCYDQGQMHDERFDHLPDLLPDSALLVRNNTRVINARLHFRKATGALIEVFCLEPAQPAVMELALSACKGCEWQCLVGNAKKWKQGALSQSVTLISGNQLILSAELTDQPKVIRFSWDDDTVTFGEILNALGQLPIPPYLKRDTEESDLTDYQTIYAHVAGSVAAPTAGLHFTEALNERLEAQGHPQLEVTLHVGAGTFLPVKSALIKDHHMHSECCLVHRSTIEQLLNNSHRSIIAVGTTSVRTLESLYWLGCQLQHNDQWDEWHVDQWVYRQEHLQSITMSDALSSVCDYLQRNNQDEIAFTTSLMIVPGYRYRIIDGLVTNFHQPESTLLLLVCALIGEEWRQVYEHALNNGYRFLSYGDACLFIQPKMV